MEDSGTITLPVKTIVQARRLSIVLVDGWHGFALLMTVQVLFHFLVFSEDMKRKQNFLIHWIISVALQGNEQ